MPKHTLKRFSPDKNKLMHKGPLKALGTMLHSSPVWHLNRRSANRAMLIGIFCALLPIPFQMGLALLFCIWFRANLPLSMGIVWLTNPITMPPVFYATYRLGAFMLSVEPITFEFQMNWEWIGSQFLLVWEPLLLGSLTSGVLLAAVGYTFVDIIWRRHTIKRWRARQKNKA